MTRFQKIKKPKARSLCKLALIGELAKRVSESAKQIIDLPWKDIAGFRDRAIHDYYEIDLEVAWGTIATDLDVLEAKLKNFTPTPTVED